MAVSARVGARGAGLRHLVLVAVFAVAMVLTVVSPVPAAVPSEQAVDFLNQQRATNGIPGDLRADPNLALGCRQHNNYMRAADAFGHGEDPSSPFYTPEGAREPPFGGNAEVLAWGDGYGADGRNPWEWAPIHLYLMLHPENTEAGYDASGGYTCMRAGGRRTGTDGSTAPPSFFSYPGPGSQGIYPDEYAAEWPYTPQQVVGIAEGAVTGTNILFFSLGTEGLKAESFSLSGPAGPVAARMVDETTSNEVGSGGWFSGGGVLVPEQPLAEHTTYAVSIKWRNLAFADRHAAELDGPLSETEFFTQAFSFTTGALSGESRRRQPWLTPALTLRRVKGGAQSTRLRLTADEVLWGRPARFVVYRHERGCGRAFASASGPCGWRRIGRRSMKWLSLRRTQVLDVRNPSRWQKATVKVRTLKFLEGDTKVAGTLAKFTLRGDGR